MPSVEVNGIRLYYERHGNTGIPVILAYGLGGNTTFWAPQVPVLAMKCRLVLYDVRGQGASGCPVSPGAYSMAAFVEDVKQLLDRLGIVQGVIGGLSMGGAIATRFALSCPERVRALIVADSASASGLPLSAANLAMRQRAESAAETQGMEAVAELMARSNPNLAAYGGDAAERAERLRRMYLRLMPHGYANASRALFRGLTPSDELSRICFPTLIIAGDKDPAAIGARAMHERIPGSRLVIIPDAGHLSNLDQPGRFNEAVLGFLDGLA